MDNPKKTSEAESGFLQQPEAVGEKIAAFVDRLCANYSRYVRDSVQLLDKYPAEYTLGDSDKVDTEKN